MSQSNRFYSNRTQNGQPKVTGYFHNEGFVTKLLSEGYLPIQHNSLPEPFKSFEVETLAGKRYVIQVRGRQAFGLDLKVGNKVQYGGRFFPAREVRGEWKGSFTLVSEIRITDKRVDPYVQTLIDAAARMQEQAQLEELPVQE